MATNSTYFVALCSFVATRYAEAGIQLDDIEREELPLTLSTFLNTISNGLRDPIPEKRKRRAPTKAANASHTSAGSGIPACVYLQALFPNTSAARDVRALEPPAQTLT